MIGKNIFVVALFLVSSLSAIEPLYVWDAPEGQKFGDCYGACTIAFSPNGRFIAFSLCNERNTEGRACILDYIQNDLKASWCPHAHATYGVYSLAFFSDNELLMSVLTGTPDTKSLMGTWQWCFDATQSKKNNSFAFRALSSDRTWAAGRVVAGVDERGLLIDLRALNLKTGELKSFSTEERVKECDEIAFVPDSHEVLFAYDAGTRRYIIARYNCDTGELISKKSFQDAKARLRALAASKSQIAAGWHEGRGIDLGYLEDLEGITNMFRQPDPARLAFSPDGEILVVSCWDDLYLFSTKTRQQLQCITQREGCGVVFRSPRREGREVAFSPDGKLLAVQNRYSVVVYAVEDLLRQNHE